MSQINYDAVRTTLTAAGYTMSAAGAQWTPQDQHNYVTYMKLHWPLTYSTILMGQAYSDILPDGFPGKEDEEPEEPEEPEERVLLSIAITGPSTVEAGSTISLTATGTYNLAPLTQVVVATWEVDDTDIATVNAGTVTGVAAGEAMITAILDDVESEPVVVTVTSATP